MIRFTWTPVFQSGLVLTQAQITKIFFIALSHTVPEIWRCKIWLNCKICLFLIFFYPQFSLRPHNPIFKINRFWWNFTWMLILWCRLTKSRSQLFRPPSVWAMAEKILTNFFHRFWWIHTNGKNAKKNVSLHHQKLWNKDSLHHQKIWNQEWMKHSKTIKIKLLNI